MKKGIIALLALTTGIAVSAQDEVIMKTQSSGTYNAFSIPEPIRIRYQSVYGDPSLATWQPATDMWFATVKGTDNRIMHVYYPTEPWYLVDVPDRDVNYRVALPVLNTYVPEDIITSALSKYGDNIYSITKLRSSSSMDTYQVTLLENGTMRMVSLE